MEEGLEQSNYEYWLNRVEYEQPHPDSRTLVMLGKAAYVLSKVKSSEEGEKDETRTVA